MNISILLSILIEGGLNCIQQCMDLGFLEPGVFSLKLIVLVAHFDQVVASSNLLSAHHDRVFLDLVDIALLNSYLRFLLGAFHF